MPDDQTSTALQIAEGRALAAPIEEAPSQVAARAMAVAEQLSEIVKRGDLSIVIGNDEGRGKGREYVRIEGWQAIASMLGLSTSVEWTRPIVDAEGNAFAWEARVAVVTREGQTVSVGEAMVGRDEKLWGGRPDYSLRSMAQTRAAGKAFRQQFGWIMSMAGYAATPAEEVGAEASDAERVEAPAPRARRADGRLEPKPPAARAPRQPAATPDEPAAAPFPAAPKNLREYFAYCLGKFGYTEAQVFEIHNATEVAQLREKGLAALMQEVQLAYDHQIATAKAAEPATEEGEYREVVTSPPDEEPPVDDIDAPLE